MADLLTSKENLGSDPREDAKINSLIDKVINYSKKLLDLQFTRGRSEK